MAKFCIHTLEIDEVVDKIFPEEFPCPWCLDLELIWLLILIFQILTQVHLNLCDGPGTERDKDCFMAV